MRRLIECLLTLARLDSAESSAALEPCALDQIACETVELLRPLALERGVRLELET